MRTGRLRGAWLLLPLALACGDGVPGGGPGDDAVRWRIVQRLIADEPAETFDRTRLYKRVKVFTWRFDSAGDLARWVELPATATPVAGGLSVRGRRPVSSLIRGVDTDASAIDAIEVDVAGLRQGPLRFFWKRAGEPFVAERGLHVRGTAGGDDEIVTHTLAVAGHAGWSGRIRRFRFDPTLAEGEEVRLEAVRGIRYKAPPGAPAKAALVAWKVDLDHELRSALLAPPGIPVERLVEVPGGARLRFAYGVGGRIEVPVTFKVTAGSASGTARTLFEARLDPARDDMSVWREASVDLDRVAGAEVLLKLEASADGDWDPSSGMPAFANPEVLAPAPAKGRPNVLLISIDTLRADHLSLYGYRRRTSPHLDAWAARSGVLFENAVASAPWTLPSHASLLTGVDSDRHGGVNHGSPVPREVLTLPEILRAAGYRTLAITGGGWMRPDYGFAQGVDLYRYWPAGVDKLEELELGVDRALEWLDRWPADPLFLFLHTFEVHSPHRRRQPFFAALAGSSDPDAGSIITEKSFTAPEDGFLLRKSFFWVRKGATPRTTPVAEDEIREVVDRYDSAIAFTDSQIGRLLEGLGELGLERDTLVVVTSDHGDAFGEKGLASHGYLYDFNLLVPLVVALPGDAGGGRRVAEQVRSVDVVPTVLDVLGLPSPPGIDGVSLLDLLAGRGRGGVPREAWSYAGSSNRGISVRLANRRKFILNNTPWPPLQGREELYDLRADPAEEHDLAGAGERLRDIRQRAVRRLVERLQGIVVQVRNGERQPLEGSLRGAAVRGNRLKVLAPEGSPLAWLDTEPGVARFTVPPGGFGAYVIEGAGTEALEIEVAIDGGGAGSFAVDTAGLERPWQLRHAGSAWRVRRSLEAAPTAVTVSRRGGPGSAVDPAAVDPQLRAELRALGYLE